jgi:TolB-like protein
VVYVLVGLAVAQGADWVFDLFELPNVASQLAAVLLVLGFPVALVLAWAYEVRPEEPRPVELTPSVIVEVPGSEHRKSIVVLPFDNMSPDPGDAYVADGLTEEIITNLSQIRPLRVISRNSALALKGTEKSTRVIGEELDVQYVLEGSVRKAGNDLRITAQLIDAKNDAHLWADTFKGTFDDVFDIQESVSRSIVDELKIELTSEEGERIADRPIQDVKAYEYYLKATAATYRISEEGMAEALRHFQLALDTIGDNALIHSGIAYIHYLLMNIGVRIEENRTKAMEAVGKAPDLDPEMPKARALFGWLTMFYRGTLKDVKEGAQHLKRALAADPDEFLALWGLTVVYIYVGRIPDAFPPALPPRRP